MEHEAASSIRQVNFHLLKFFFLPLLALKGIDHYWTYVFFFFWGGVLTK